MKKGFSLLELLVVILIIGILAAVMLPQYNRVVEKANAAEALPLLKALWQSEQNYYLLHDIYATKFKDLDVDIPWTGNVKYRDSSVMRDTISNDKWSLQIYQEDGYGTALVLGRISGRYKGAGFGIDCSPSMKISCKERKDNGIIFEGHEGDYCEKIFKATNKTENWQGRSYSMP